MTGTIVTGLALLAVVAAIIVKLIRARKRGKCAGCPFAGACHTKGVCSAQGEGLTNKGGEKM